jgi:putative phosphoribosyl transferase
MIFQDRFDAAEKLAEKLQWLKEEDKEEGIQRKSVIILSVPRGGVVIGDIISRILDAKLDVVVSRKVGAPYNPELAIGAVMPDGSFFPNENIIKILKISDSYINAEIAAQMKEIDRRLISFRGSKDYGNHLQYKTVVLVDDGIATGATILAATQWLKKKRNNKKLIIAVPVAPKDIADNLNKVADKVVILYSPSSFESVGQFYQDFSQVSDNQVKKIMHRHGYKVSLNFSFTTIIL